VKKTKPGQLFALFALMLSALPGCAEEKASLTVRTAAADGGPKPADAGSAAAKGDGSAGDAAVVTDGPYVSAAGIGVSDLAVSKQFYTEVLGLKFLYHLDTEVWSEDVYEDLRGNHVVLMDFVRDRNTTKNPVKLVFAVENLEEYYQKVLDSGGSSAAAPTMFGTTKVALTFDPDGYLLELIEASTATRPVLVGMGVGVSSLDEAADYYTRVLGMKFVRDIDVPGFMDEKELASPLMRGPSIVLMHYEDTTRVYSDIPAKIVFGVKNAASYAAKIEREDSEKLLQAPAPYGDSGLIVGMARDLDGYLVEILQSAGTGDAGAAK
jgi:lactoylglutathione lyase